MYARLIEHANEGSYRKIYLVVEWRNHLLIIILGKYSQPLNYIKKSFEKKLQNK